MDSANARPPAVDAAIAPAPGELNEARRRRRVPTVLQMETTECGAACLAMILAAYRCWRPLDELRAACGVSRDGSKASNILRAARMYGMAAKGYKLGTKMLHRSAFPAIIFWNFNHFVVLEGTDPKTGAAWINDPASGPRRVDHEEFDRKFTGVFLAFQPTGQFRRSGSKPAVWRGVRSRLGRSGGLVGALALFSVGLIVPGLAAPFLIQLFVDEVLVAGLHDWVASLLLGLALAAVLRAGLTGLQHSLSARLEAKLAVIEVSRLFWHMFRLPMEFFNLRYVGDLAYRIGSADRVVRLLSRQTGTALAAAITVLFYGTVMVLYNPALAGVSLLAVLGNALTLRVLWRRQEDTSRRLVREMSRLSAASVAMIAMIETLKASGRETEAFSRWSGMQAEYLNAQQGTAQTAAMLSTIPSVLQGLTDVAILAVGGLAVMRGDLTVGGLVAFQSLSGALAAPLESLTGLGASLQAMRGELARLDDVLHHKPVPHLQDPAIALARPVPRQLSGRLELREVTFGYSRIAPPVFDRISLVLEPGARVALVGGSGSGKTSLGRVAAGLYQPWSGEILLDGVPPDRIQPQILAANVAYVDQSVFLFAGTVRDNLTLWDPTMDDANLVRALADAQVLDTAESRPGRLDSKVLEFGANFSGGQRQRLEIARALALNPSLIVLDEATAALDPLVEREIEFAIRRRGCASLVIAHRLSTVRDADEIIVLDRGRIVQRGRHEELLAAEGAYQVLMRAAQGGAA